MMIERIEQMNKIPGLLHKSKTKKGENDENLPGFVMTRKAD